MVTLIAALGKQGQLGLKGKMPWYLKSDFKHFKESTMGKTLIMGRKTFDSIGRPLPGRKTIVVTRNPQWSYDGVSIAHSLEEAFNLCQEEAVIAGGGTLYEQALEKADKMILSRVEYDGEADTFFPSFNEEDWKVKKVEVKSHELDDHKWTLEVLEKNLGVSKN